jgi:hypothetical protein
MPTKSKLCKYKTFPNKVLIISTKSQDFYQQSLNTIDFYQQSLINDKVALCFRYTEFITNINSKAIYSITKSYEQQQVRSKQVDIK